MAPSKVSRLLLVADQASVAIEEVTRLGRLRTTPVSIEAELTIFNYMNTLKTGIEQLEEEVATAPQSTGFKSKSDGLARLQKTYSQLYDSLKSVAQSDMAPLAYTLGLRTAQIKAQAEAHEKQISKTPICPEAFAISGKPANARVPKSVRFSQNLEDTTSYSDSVYPSSAQSHGSRQFEPYRDDPDAAFIDDVNQDRSQSAEVVYQQQQQQLNYQDEHLERLSSSVLRQHRLGLDINGELESQMELLEHVDEMVDDTSNRLQNAKRRLTTVSRKAKENGSWLTIFALLVILILLLVVLA
ncbi:hypothetical protein NADFUDRAFT_52239 [Nadsonia fulvescens var. elongata DSM 6958]|uniref:t-SNARE coiled-coil homology domain-containing protein n=1 Tax=Nadsonia fulvescens var. elongata DSM 6958 TaxID=857566 RepID=A0A1E3PGP4_9ASCO|nr:hypothetical protein NADFUDRAFT_52239 [Nadsonia fulvescens var. elongata DSM 6958]